MISGENGCGKTSVLEAIYEAMRGKSFRAVDEEIVKRGEQFYRVELEYTNGERVIVVYDAMTAKKSFLVGDKKSARLPKKYKYPIVLFEPGDLGLMSTGPAKRREYFDRMLGQLNEVYASSLSKYNKALRQRNELLKTENVRGDAVFSWNVLLSRLGTEIWRERTKMVEQINAELTETYRSIAENEDKVNLQIKGDLEEEREEELNESAYLRELEQRFERDKLLGHTSFGVHKDDYRFKFNGREANGSASRGEVRSVVIALKFIEAKMIEQKLGKKPVVLLDDVFSELDEERQRALVKNFRENQVIITSVSAV